MEPALVVEGVVARYGSRTILDGVDLIVQPGEIRTVLGGSGCGKSTLLKCCVGLKTPDAGRAVMLGSELSTLDEADQRKLLTRVGVLFQYGAMLGSITVGENVALPLREHTDLPIGVVREIVRLKLAQVELSHAEHLLPSELSGGMRKRAGLARALALDPALLFCDEPGAGLDPLTSAELDALLLRIRDQFGVAMVVITHELMSIKKIADKALMLSAGKVIADGTLKEVMATDHPEVRAFFGRQAAGELRAPPSALDVLSGAKA